MMNKIPFGQLYNQRIQPGKPAGPAAQTNPLQPSRPSNPARATFADVLQDKLVRLSHHAETRLNQRGIQLSPEQLAKIDSAIEKAARKGAKESLMLMNDMALIVSIQNKTIVTAMDAASIKDNVFTQIDSAVIIS